MYKNNLMDKLIQSFACENRAEIVAALKQIVLSSLHLDMVVYVWGTDEIEFGSFEVKCIAELLDAQKIAAYIDTGYLAQVMCDAMSGIPINRNAEQFTTAAQCCRNILQRRMVIQAVMEILPMPIWEEVIDQL